MKLSIIDENGDFSAHGEYEPGVDPVVLHCPFCGNDNIVVENTHMPSYSVECLACGAVGPSGTPSGAPTEWERIRSIENVTPLHREAFDAAIRAWNDRRGQK